MEDDLEMEAGSSSFRMPLPSLPTATICGEKREKCENRSVRQICNVGKGGGSERGGVACGCIWHA